MIFPKPRIITDVYFMVKYQYARSFKRVRARLKKEHPELSKEEISEQAKDICRCHSGMWVTCKIADAHYYETKENVAGFGLLEEDKIWYLYGEGHANHAIGDVLFYLIYKKFFSITPDLIPGRFGKEYNLIPGFWDSKTVKLTGRTKIIEQYYKEHFPEM